MIVMGSVVGSDLVRRRAFVAMLSVTQSAAVCAPVGDPIGARTVARIASRRNACTRCEERRTTPGETGTIILNVSDKDRETTIDEGGEAKP